ncbi:MAG: hypothetical protein GY868_15200, partial [Deltaproteobacteria bacterium]|nr:hypothetical protein [Deltaproteobacteria bacterium]
MKKKINIVLGILLSSVFIYLAFRGINFTELTASFKSANYLYFFPVVVIVVFTHYLRCYRWGKIMDSLVTYDQKTIFIMGSIGFMA